MNLSYCVFNKSKPPLPLSTQIPEFSEENISASVLHRLLRQDVIREVEPDGKPIIESGKTVDFMAMILTVSSALIFHTF